MADSSVSLYKDRDCQPTPATVNIYIYMKKYTFDLGHIKEFQALPGNILLKQLVL